MPDKAEVIIEILQKAEAFIVPVEWVDEKLKEIVPSDYSYSKQLLELFRKDNRFKLFEGPELGALEKAAASDRLSNHIPNHIRYGPRVMLKTRIPSKNQIITFLLEKADQTYDALYKTWEIRPKDDESIEDQLLSALAKAQKLQRELRFVIKKQHEADNSSSETINFSNKSSIHSE